MSFFADRLGYSDRCAGRVPDPKKPGKLKKCPAKATLRVNAGREEQWVCEKCATAKFAAFVAGIRT